MGRVSGGGKDGASKCGVSVAAAGPGTFKSEVAGVVGPSLLVYISIVFGPGDVRTERDRRPCSLCFTCFCLLAFVVFSRFRHGKGDCFFNRCLAVHT